MWHNYSPEGNYDKCPLLREISPPMASLRGVAFLYTWTRPSESYPFDIQDEYCHRVGLAALLPYNMPELREIYLIDRSIQLRTCINNPRQRLAPVPRFTGYLSTFYEVRVNKTAHNLWEIRKDNGELLPVFKCAVALKKHSDFVHINSDHNGPKIAINALAVIQQIPEQ